jgi:hypothetical protein
MDSIALWPALGITPALREKLMWISPAAIDRVVLALKGKSLTKSGELLKHRIPIRTFYTSEERNISGFIQIETVRHCGQASISSPSPLRCRFRLDLPLLPPQ